MEKITNRSYIIISVVIAIILIYMGTNTSKCRGETCDSVKKDVKEYQDFPKMIPEIINKQVAGNEIVLLDVREDSEWYEGHINGAKHIALGAIDSGTTKELPKNIPIYVYCRSGKRAEEGKLKLKALGFDNVENIGGVISWLERGGKLVK